jgi:hypothetical protein
MAATVSCGNCGGKVKLPGGFSKAKIRCGMCGYYAAVPPDMRSEAGAEEDDSPPPPKKKAKASARPAPKPPVTTSDDTPLEPKTRSDTAPPPPPRRKVEPVDDDDAPPPPPRRERAAPAADAPKPVRARPKTDPKDKRAEFGTQHGEGKPLLEGNQDEDDPSPYGVEGDGLKRCQECQGELPHDATFCVHCGTHLNEDGEAVRKKKKKRTYTPIDQEFGEGWPLPTRLAVMGGVLCLNVLLSVVSVLAVADEGKVNALGIGTGGFVLLINSSMQAFILGSFDTLRIQRNEKGKAVLTRTRRIAFLPNSPQVIEWKHLTGVGRVATHSGSIIDWVTCIYLLVFAGCLPGILFWWFILKPERYHTVLCNLYGGIEETLFRGKDQQQAEEIADLVGEATGLDVKGTL